MLPTSLRIVYALNSSQFQISSLALLSIVNTRVSIEAAYLPAYGAISFLPFSLRPIFAWISSLILQRLGKDDVNKNRHDKLLCPVLVLASLSFLGTIFIPTDGVVLCFVWGFLRGVAGAWSDFLIGMTVIEFSKLQSKLMPNDNTSYEQQQQITSMNTAQSSTAKNIGGFIASIGTFIFFSQNQSISEKVANTLLLVTALILLLASFASIKYQYHVSKMLDQSTYDTINDNDDEDISAVEQSTIEDDRDGIIEESRLQESPNTSHRQQIIEVSTLVSFQILLAVSALRVPIIAVSSQQIWIALMITFVIILGCTLCIGYKHENQQQQQSDTTHTRRMKDDKERLSHRRLNLYFLLRYSLPIAGFIMYSYLYTVFESQPLFLQLMSVLKTAIGSLSTYTYEKFLSPQCHSGWNLIGLIAILDVTMGLIALLDVWVIRASRDRLVDGEYIIDTKLKWLVATVGLVKYFFAELDYQPSLVLSTTNVYNDDDNTLPSEEKVSENADTNDFNDEIETFDEYGYKSNTPSSLSIDLNDDNTETFSPVSSSLSRKVPLVSASMQYASFLSCIDFGAQIGDWISVPIIASLDITRENHWVSLSQKICMRCVRTLS